MIYLDYSATTKTDDEVLDTFVKCSKDFIGNPNSLHKLGVDSKNIIDKSTEQITKLLNIDDYDVIYTSGSSVEGNATGVCEYCNSKIIFDSYDWVMSKKQKIRQR